MMVCAIPAVIFYIYLTPDSFILFLIYTLILVIVVAIIIFVIGLETEERKWLINKILIIFKHKI